MILGDVQGRCASALMQGCLGILPAMEMDVLDEMMGEQTGHQVLATTVGNSYILKLAKLGITEVWLCGVHVHILHTRTKDGHIMHVITV